MYTSFHIKNFRGFRDLTLDGLARVNLIAGGNNVGKTALLEAIFQLVGANNPELGLRVNSWRGIQRFRVDIDDIWASLFYKYNIDTDIELSATHEKYGLRNLHISIVDSPTSQTDLQNGNSASAATVSESGREIKLEYQDAEGKTIISRSYVSENEIINERGKVEDKPKGIFLSTRYQNLSDDADRFSDLAVVGQTDDLTATLNILDSRLSNLSIQVKGGMPVIHGDIGIGRLIPIPIMGEGMKKLLSITLAIKAFPEGIVLIDEIENGLHYSVMTKVWQAIGQAARNADVQIFATTHSWECIRAAHEAFSAEPEYDFRLHRLERVNDDIRTVTLDKSMLDTAINVGFEVR